MDFILTDSGPTCLVGSEHLGKRVEEAVES
jgi:hypothetical protein